MNYFIMVDADGEESIRYPWVDTIHLFTGLGLFYPQWVSVKIYKNDELVEIITRSFTN